MDENLLCSFQILKGATADYKFPRWGLNMSGSESLLHQALLYQLTGPPTSQNEHP